MIALSRDRASVARTPKPMAAVQADAPRRKASRITQIGIAGVALAGLAAGAAVLRHRSRRDVNAGEPVTALADDTAAARSPSRAVIAARQLNRAAGVLAFSVLADSGLEHYRGSYRNAAMVVAPVVSAATLAISAHGLVDRRVVMHRVRHAVYAAAALTGFAGTCFHAYNITKRVGGISWLNLFYGAPLGAPAAIGLAGGLGYCAERVRATAAVHAPARLFGRSAGRVLAIFTSIGLLGTSSEVALLHFRGAFHNPAMYLPVGIPPVAALALALAATNGGDGRRFARWMLRLTAVTGVAGMGFHAYGISRNMGGWLNWSQNILNGPPLPAPPSFTGLALAGLAAVGLMQGNGNGQ